MEVARGNGNVHSRTSHDEEGDNVLHTTVKVISICHAHFLAEYFAEVLQVLQHLFIYLFIYFFVVFILF